MNYEDNKNYADKRFASLSEMINRETTIQKHTPEGYPKRDTSINHEDITNLIIALYTTKDVSQFLVVI